MSDFFLGVLVGALLVPALYGATHPYSRQLLREELARRAFTGDKDASDT